MFLWTGLDYKNPQVVKKLGDDFLGHPENTLNRMKIRPVITAD